MTKLEKYLSSQGFDLDELKEDKNSYEVTNMDKVAEKIKACTADGTFVYVIGDYDCDGVMSSWNMHIILKEMGIKHLVRFPRRMSEGYGASPAMVDEAPEKSLIVTIDNGIAAVEAVERAKETGHEVIILDHHEMRGDGVIPPADIVVDPHVVYTEGEFDGYCGAGLAYKLGLKLGLAQETLDTLNVLAAVATIADVVPLTKDNRNIVRKGLKLLNASPEYLTSRIPYLYNLCHQCDPKYHSVIPSEDPKTGIGAKDIAFQIAPCVNAMGRMLDDGAKQCLMSLCGYVMPGQDKDITTKRRNVTKLVDWNAERKACQTELTEICMKEPVSDDDTCLVYYLPADTSLNAAGGKTVCIEGIVGIVAGKLCDTYRRPCIVLTDDANEPEVLKGSARSVDGVHIKDALDAVDMGGQYLVKYGGHAGAAGLSVKRDMLDAFRQAMNSYIRLPEEQKKEWGCDVELTEEEIPAFYDEMEKLAPWGEGMKPPVVMVKGYHVKTSRDKGTSGIGMNGTCTELMSWDLREEYNALGRPEMIDVTGTVEWSKYSRKPVIMLTGIRKSQAQPARRMLI